MMLAVAQIEHFQPFPQIEAILGDAEAMSAAYRLSEVRQTHKQRCQAKATRGNDSNHE